MVLNLSEVIGNRLLAKIIKFFNLFTRKNAQIHAYIFVHKFREGHNSFKILTVIPVAVSVRTGESGLSFSVSGAPPATIQICSNENMSLYCPHSPPHVGNHVTNIHGAHLTR